MSWDFERLEVQENERRRKYLNVIALMVLTAAFLLVGGCSLTERLGSSSKKTPTPAVEDGILEFESEEAAVPEKQETVQVTLYYKDAENSCLVPVTQDVPKVTGIAKTALEALLQGEAEGELLSALPEGAEVRELNIKPDGTCVVDLNKEAAQIAENAPKEEALAVYAIVNTLTEFSTVEKVQILVDGQINKTFAGHIPVDVPLQRDLSFVKI
ncbi:MAG: GerMN domain-containing protein [Syntrophaceticus sp.]|nr:GerMN domain-containing protein [Syntrophaceticus sp.]